MGRYGLRIRDIKDSRERKKASRRWKRATNLAHKRDGRDRAEDAEDLRLRALDAERALREGYREDAAALAHESRQLRKRAARLEVGR